MSSNTSIEWTDATWSPLRARRTDTGKVGQHCERVSAGCVNCYAARHNGRNLPNGGTGLDYVRGSRDIVETFVDERVLVQPLKWSKPRRIFVCNQTDLFADFYTDEQRDRVFAAMALAPQHTFQLLTKRPERMRTFVVRMFNRGEIHDAFEPHQLRVHPAVFSHVWLGVSVENQATANERIPLLLDTPAEVRFISAEPLLEKIDLTRVSAFAGYTFNALLPWSATMRGLDWVIVGGESGPGARPCMLNELREVVDQCRAASVPVFVKQIGARPIAMPYTGSGRKYTLTEMLDEDGQGLEELGKILGATRGLTLRDPKGGDPSEWPERYCAGLNVREFPKVGAS